MNSKVIKSMFMLVISFIFASLCITFAWFTGLRIQNVEGGGIQLGNLTGELFVYKGNYNILSDNTKEASGYSSSALQTGVLQPDNAFEKFGVDTFSMDSAKPSSRYLFVLKAKSNHAEPVNIKLNIDNWSSNFTTINPNDNTTERVYLTQAMYMYSNSSADGNDTTKLMASDTNQTLSPDDVTNVIGWADSLVINGTPSHTPNDIYPQNKFKQTAGDNFKDQTHTTFNAPVTIGRWNNVDNTKYYLYPFIVEFSNDINTYYKLSNGVYTKYVQGADTTGYNSNIYGGLYFQIKQLSLTQMDDPQPQA